MAYESGRTVLEQVDVDIARGEFVSLIGPSGCGKTTLLNIVAGLLQPTRGKVSLDGRAIERPGVDRSMVFQDDAVFPWYSVQRNVEYGLRSSHAAVERRERAKHLIEMVGLAGREDAYPKQLSGGMRKRVDVARALAPNPKVLLMDEPFGTLDAITKTRLQVEFLRLWDRERMTVLFVTHDIEEALFLSDRLLVMQVNPGRVALDMRVPFPRPRDLEIRTTPEFQALRQELTAALDPEAAR